MRGPGGGAGPGGGVGGAAGAGARARGCGRRRAWVGAERRAAGWEPGPGRCRLCTGCTPNMCWLGG